MTTKYTIAILESDARKAINNSRLCFDTYFDAIRAQETLLAWYNVNQLGSSGVSIWRFDFPEPTVTKI